MSYRDRYNAFGKRIETVWNAPRRNTDASTTPKWLQFICEYCHEDFITEADKKHDERFMCNKCGTTYKAVTYDNFGSWRMKLVKRAMEPFWKDI